VRPRLVDLATLMPPVTRYPRLRLRQTLREQEPPGSWHARSIDPSDVPALGALMLAAYRGTVDDEGETEADAVAEVERTLSGEYGSFLSDCSFAVNDDARIVGASSVTVWEGTPIATYLVVRPEMKRQGLGTFLMASSGNALVRARYTHMDLFVTEANEPAVRLYRKLGFQVVDRITDPSLDP
jgi:ribosomal protein S18 acetylase RimI-like enzyme